MHSEYVKTLNVRHVSPIWFISLIKQQYIENILKHWLMSSPGKNSTEMCCSTVMQYAEIGVDIC